MRDKMKTKVNLKKRKNIRTQQCKGGMPRVFIDGGKWYPWALQRLAFKYTIIKFGGVKLMVSLK